MLHRIGQSPREDLAGTTRGIEWLRRVIRRRWTAVSPGLRIGDTELLITHEDVMLSVVNHRQLNSAAVTISSAARPRLVQRVIGREAIEDETLAKDAKARPPSEDDDNARRQPG